MTPDSLQTFSRDIGYGFGRSLEVPFDAALARARQALAGEGFGVLCEIDVQAKLKEKLGADIGPYTILGACHPGSAHRAIAAEPDIGLLLPCNVLIYQRDGRSVVEAIDARRMMDFVGNPALSEVALDVHQRLTRVIAAL